MAIAFKKAVTSDTQSLRDSIDLSEQELEEIPCGRCDAVYVLVYPKSLTADQKLQYGRTVQEGMAGCGHHPAWIKLPF
ncbi:MAG: hypothetical protein DMG21_18355 [Acidobacteria bacterium]|nr:MAG: hypothetical protein DMG21_18355 [Acidobacteriota bacterium]